MLGNTKRKLLAKLNLLKDRQILWWAPNKRDLPPQWYKINEEIKKLQLELRSTNGG